LDIALRLNGNHHPRDCGEIRILDRIKKPSLEFSGDGFLFGRFEGFGFIQVTSPERKNDTI